MKKKHDKPKKPNNKMIIIAAILQTISSILNVLQPLINSSFYSIIVSLIAMSCTIVAVWIVIIQWQKLYLFYEIFMASIGPKYDNIKNVKPNMLKMEPDPTDKKHFKRGNW